jgi:hypothetical protein
MAVHTKLMPSDASRRRMMIASLRYLDTFSKIDQSWYFGESNLIPTGARRDHSARRRRADGR